MMKLKLKDIDLSVFKADNHPLNAKSIYDYDYFICSHQNNTEVKLQLIFVKKTALIEKSETSEVVSFLRFMLAELRIHKSFAWPDIHSYKDFILFSCPAKKISVVDIYNKSQHFPEKSIAYICKELLKVLIFIHENGVILNIEGYGGYVYTDGSIKIDVMHIVEDTQKIIYPHSESTGDVLYCAPEVINGGEVSMQADIYVFGMELFLLLEGQEPKLFLDNKRFRYRYLLLMHTRTGFPALSNRELWSQDMLDVLDSTLTYHEKDRLKARELLLNPIFNDSHSKKEFVDFALRISELL